MCGGPRPSFGRLLCHGMAVLAVRTYEPWTALSLSAGLLLVALLAAVSILALTRRNR